MSIRRLIPLFVAGVIATTGHLAHAVTIEVAYPYSALFDVTFKRIMT